MAGLAGFWTVAGDSAELAFSCLVSKGVGSVGVTVRGFGVVDLGLLGVADRGLGVADLTDGPDALAEAGAAACEALAEAGVAA